MLFQALPLKFLRIQISVLKYEITTERKKDKIEQENDVGKMKKMKMTPKQSVRYLHKKNFFLILMKLNAILQVFVLEI